MKRLLPTIQLILAISLCLSACMPANLPTQPPASGGNAPQDPNQVLEPAGGGDLPTATSTNTTEAPAGPTASPTLQSFTIPIVYGPDLEQFPQGISPLTGLPADDPALLGLPAVLVSITNFPPSARPQAGLSSSPWVWELYIGEGTTRFLVTFYGEEPGAEADVRGTCEVRQGPFASTGSPVLGNRAWFDKNANGIQDEREPGVGGVCVTLQDTAGSILQTTSTDSNGYFGFNVEAGQTYVLGFEVLDALGLTLRDVGFEDSDSDPDPLTGKTAPIPVQAGDLTQDAGYVSSAVPGPTDTPVPGQPTPTPSAGQGVTGGPVQVGPVRSMRTAYENIRTFFPGGCLVAASGYYAVLAQTRGCQMVYGSDEGDINSAMLDITRIRELAESNVDPLHPTNYSGNVFDINPPAGGVPAQELKVFWSWQNQALWRYDALSGAFQRNDNFPGAEDTFVQESDRLTGRQLLFENVIVMIVEHTAKAESWIDIDLTVGNMGRAYLFRDGQMYPIYWSTLAGDYEKSTSMLRPVKFVDGNRQPFPLKPGHTWVNIFTPASGVSEQSAGSWLGRFIAPPIP